MSVSGKGFETSVRRRSSESLRVLYLSAETVLGMTLNELDALGQSQVSDYGHTRSGVVT